MTVILIMTQLRQVVVIAVMIVGWNDNFSKDNFEDLNLRMMGVAYKGIAGVLTVIISGCHMIRFL